MLSMLRRSLPAVAVVALTSGVAGCGAAGTSATGTSATDRQADVLADAIAYPRQHDAVGFARAALATTLGRSGTLAILEASDLDPGSATDPAALLVIRIHVPAHVSEGFGDESTAPFDACYRIQYELPSSALAGDPERLDCPAGAVPVTPAPPPPAPDLPPHASVLLARVLRSLPPSPTEAAAEAALRSVFSPEVRVDALVQHGQVAVAAGVGSAEQIRCRVAVRIRDRVHRVLPQPESLLPGEVGCSAALAFLGPTWR
jgi:hypothetical protein